MILRNYLFKSDSIMSSDEKKNIIMKLSEENGYPRPIEELYNGIGIVRNFFLFTKDRIYVNPYNDIASITFFNPPGDISEKIDAVVVKFDMGVINKLFNSVQTMLYAKLNFGVSLMSFDMEDKTYISPILKIRIKVLDPMVSTDIKYILEITKNRSSFSFSKRYLGVIHDKNDNSVFKLMITKLQ